MSSFYFAMRHYFNSTELQFSSGIWKCGGEEEITHPAMIRGLSDAYFKFIYIV